MTTVGIRSRTMLGSVGDGAESSGRARYSAHLYFPALLIVTVEGEVDAANRRDLGRYIERELRPTTQLLLDMRAVDFFGAQGFSALHFVSVCCNRWDVDWIVVGSRQCPPPAGHPRSRPRTAADQRLRLGVPAPRTSRLPPLSDSRRRYPPDRVQLTPRRAAGLRPIAAVIHLHMRQIMEREDKWDVDDRFVLPDLERVVDGATVQHDTVDLTSTYYDTTDRDSAGVRDPGAPPRR